MILNNHLLLKSESRKRRGNHTTTAPFSASTSWETGFGDIFEKKVIKAEKKLDRR